MKRLNPSIAIAIGAFSFGLIPIFGTMLSRRGVSAFEQTFFMEVLSFLILIPIYFKYLKQKTLEKKDVLFFTIFGAMLYGVNLFPLTAYAIGTPVAFVALILYLNPIFTILIAKLWFKENISFKKLLYVVIALLGVVLVLNEGLLSNKIEASGVILAVLSALSLSLWGNFGKAAGIKKYGAFDTMFWSAAGAFVLLLASLFIFPTLFAAKPIWSFTLSLSFEAYTLLFFMALICVVIGHTLYFWGVEKISVITGSIILLIEPVAAIVLSVILFGQGITLTSIIGGIIVLVTSVLISIEEG